MRAPGSASRIQRIIDRTSHAAWAMPWIPSTMLIDVKPSPERKPGPRRSPWLGQDGKSEVQAMLVAEPSRAEDSEVDGSLSHSEAVDAHQPGATQVAAA